MNFTTDRTEFAAKADEVQLKDEKYLMGSARSALRRVGEKEWFKPLLNRVEQVMRTAYRRESGHTSSDALRAAVASMRKDVAASLEKTKKPEPKDLQARAKALAGSLAAYAIAHGTEIAAFDDESEIGLEWVTMHDDRVRAAHKAADGQVRLPGEKYDVDGVQMSRPGDVTAPIELWINCRCALRPRPMGPSEAMVAAATEYEDQGVGIFLLPAENDPVLDLSSENPPHVTVIWMGMEGDIEVPLNDVQQDIDMVARDFAPVDVQVKERGALGDDDADVAFLNRDQLVDLREALLQHETIRTAMEAVEQYPDWTPHLTLGYPETPANEGEPPSTIRLDRLALFVGKNHHEYPLGGEMPETDVVEEIDNIDDIEEIDASEVVMWHGVLAPEGVTTGDGRKFALDSLRWRDLPLPLANQKTNMPGHDGSVVTGRIDHVWRDEANLLQAQGVFLSTAEADEHINLIAEGAAPGVSVDVDDAEMSFEDGDGNALTLDSEIGDDTKVITVVTSGRICGATGCAIPAFAEAYIALGPHPALQADTFREISSEERDRMAKNGEAMPDGSFPIATEEDLKNAIQAIGRAKDPDAAKAHIKKRAKALGKEDLIPDEWAVVTAGATEEFVKTEDGPGWLTHPVDTERLRRYWTKGKGAAKIRWGVPGDFNRCREQVAKYIKPQYLSGYCANRHYDALGFWPGRPVSAETVPMGGQMMHLVAAAGTATTVAPPREWLDDPHLMGPTRLSITEDGHIFGHLAEWGTCHIGFQDVCTTPPESLSGYLYFATGVLDTTDGAVPVGQITMGCGHAGEGSARVAAAHYDNLGWAVADIAIGEDEFGIWFSGAIRPGVSEEQIAALRAAGSVSGDWRRIGEGLELVAALAVNVPGFPITPTRLHASGGVQTSLVASGIVLTPEKSQATLKEIVAAAVSARLEEVEVERVMADLRKKTQRDPASVMAGIAAKRERK